jgi:hypothetical protein
VKARDAKQQHQLDVFCFGAAADTEKVTAAFAGAKKITWCPGDLVTPGAEEASRAEQQLRRVRQPWEVQQREQVRQAQLAQQAQQRLDQVLQAQQVRQAQHARQVRLAQQAQQTQQAQQAQLEQVQAQLEQVQAQLQHAQLQQAQQLHGVRLTDVRAAEGATTITFGKHSGRTWQWVVENDPEHAQWCVATAAKDPDYFHG